MKTNTLGKVKMQSSARPRSRFDLTHNVNTTFGFGETQPLSCRLLVPGTKSICSNESLIRLAPMVSPTFGLMKMKTWHYFVAMSDLSRNFAALMAQTKVSRFDRTFYPSEVPSITACSLYAQILNGAHLSVWECNSPSDSPDLNGWATFDTHHNSQDVNAIYNRLVDAHLLSLETSSYLGNHNGLVLDLSAVCPKLPLNSESSVSSPIWLQNKTKESLFERTNEADVVINTDADGFDDSLVYLDTADYVSLRNVTNNKSYAFAFRLSSFGKRLRKILQGLGYQINFNDTSRVSLMPLFAYYKAYFDTFGLVLYSNWDTTNCAKLLEYYDVGNVTNYDPYLIRNNSGYSVFFEFLKDLGSCWTTSEQDYVAAHTRTIGVSPFLPDLNSFLSSSGTVSSTVGAPPITQNADPFGVAAVGTNTQAYIDRTQHCQLDSELLKSLYKWTNRNTIAGKRIELLLRAQGLGDYVDSCKPRFIGYTEVDIDVSDVVSQSDTFNEATNTGSQLGQYGGRGIGYDAKASAKTFEYENDEFGFWITFAAIVPYSGYTQMIDSSVKCIKKMDFYNPEFDGKGYEATRKLDIVGNQSVVSDNDSQLQADTFGFVPKYSSLKVASNLMNGDFNLRSTRDIYVPFTIDKILDVGERYVKNLGVNTSTGIIGATMRKVFKPSDLPVAGPNPWRYDTRYAWLGNFNRIFSYKGDLTNEEANKVGIAEWFGLLPENFMVHNTYRFIMQAPMLPIAESFETLEDGNDGKANMSISKA